MTEINLDLAEAYFKDRCDELLNYDVKAGTPFVFISGLTILNVLGGLSVNVKNHLPGEYKRVDIFNTLLGLINYFSLRPEEGAKVVFVHNDDKHLDITSSNTYKYIVTLSAESFIKDVKLAVEGVFKDIRSCPNRSASTLWALNHSKPVGYGDV